MKFLWILTVFSIFSSAVFAGEKSCPTLAGPPRPVGDELLDDEGDIPPGLCDQWKAEEARLAGDLKAKAEAEKSAAEKAASEKAEAEKRAKEEEQARKEKEDQERRASIVSGGTSTAGGSTPSSYQASEEPVERHGAVISPIRELSSTEALESRPRFALTEKQVDDVKKATAILNGQPLTSEEKKNLDSILGKFYQGEIDAKTVSTEMGKIAARLEALQVSLASAPAAPSAPQQPDLTLNFDNSQQAPNPFGGFVGGGQAKVEVNQSSENEAKALVEKQLAAEKNEGSKAGSDDEYSWLADLFNPSLFVQNVKQAVGAFFGPDFDPKVSKALQDLQKNGKGRKVMAQANGKISERELANDYHQLRAPMIKHALTLSFLLLPFGAGIAAFAVWKKRKKSTGKVSATQFRVKKASSKTIFTEKDGTRVEKSNAMTPPP